MGPGAVPIPPFLYLCLSCRCRAGCSCRARRSTCRSRGTPAPRSPRRPQRNCRVGSPASSRIAGGKRGGGWGGGESTRTPRPAPCAPAGATPAGLTKPVLSVHWKSCSTILSLSPIQVFSCPKPGERGVRGGPQPPTPAPMEVRSTQGCRCLESSRSRSPLGCRIRGWRVMGSSCQCRRDMGTPPVSQPPPQARTVDEAVLLLRVDAGEVPGAAAAVPLRVLPGAPAGEVAVAVALELVPVVVAALRVCGDMGTLGTGASPQRPGTHGDAPRCGGGSRVLPRRGRGWIWPVMLPSGGTRGLPRASLPTFLAAAAPVAGQAEADEGVDLVDAGAAVLAGARQAVVDVCGDGGGLWARRDPPPGTLLPTPAPPAAWARHAGVLTDLAVLPGEALGAAAAADGAVGVAGPAVQARVVLARVGRGCGAGAGAVTGGTPVLRPYPPHCPHHAAPCTGTPTQPRHQPQLLAGNVGTTQTQSWSCPRALARGPRRLFRLSVALNLTYICYFFFFFPQTPKVCVCSTPSAGSCLASYYYQRLQILNI